MNDDLEFQAVVNGVAEGFLRGMSRHSDEVELIYKGLAEALPDEFSQGAPPSAAMFMVAAAAEDLLASDPTLTPEHVARAFALCLEQVILTVLEEDDGDDEA